MFNRRSLVPVALSLFVVLIVSIVLYQVDVINEFLEQEWNASEIIPSPLSPTSTNSDPKLVAYPIDVHFENTNAGDTTEPEPFKPQAPPDDEFSIHQTLQSGKRYKALSPSIISQKYSPSQITVFENKQINGKLDRCNEVESVSKDLHSSQTQYLDASLENILKKLEQDNPKYFSELLSEIPKQLKEKSWGEYWFRFGGASVWLPEYGVHFLSSRVIYSPSKSKSNPLISFIYVQLFDADWNEKTDISLKVPSGKDYVEMSFPTILPIDFWYHNEPIKTRRYFGPEDPRILLVKNEEGYEEPLLVFNMVSRKGGSDNEEASLFRTMYGYYPYSQKMTEFDLPDAEGVKVQKNWTPISSEPEEGYHKTINFIYRYENLQMLKCELETGKCSYRYKLDPTMDVETPVGSLRGGTPLLPLPKHKSINLPEGKRYWVGFARAHIFDCGCGSSIYRPNLVILEEIGGTFYELSHVSGSIGFNIKMEGWSVKNKPCDGQSVLIPNGISYWEVNEGAEEEIEDYLGLTVSVSDSNVQLLHVRGLLKFILSLPGIIDAPNEESLHPGVDNVSCAIQNANDFCGEFGRANS